MDQPFGTHGRQVAREAGSTPPRCHSAWGPLACTAIEVAPSAGFIKGPLVLVASKSNCMGCKVLSLTDQ